MLSFRKEIFPEDVFRIREILESSGFFEAAPDEIDVAVELAEAALKDGLQAQYGLRRVDKRGCAHCPGTWRNETAASDGRTGTVHSDAEILSFLRF